ncbi:2-amino-4-hydroxy-6-hydroxymethyldihydropteridine diphosphokinase [Legionella hackeliae]|uniref:2-amino-4-hydroxy-6-hydroxymethyldihydropteridine pyrophosphokinase n=1 Tax=Legionella hackeliae TaxID=449 RepID=A0A0A8UT33_LEGHA|nr:2-amino-4-hydroxy-6-hydroxymethyldihydropteridine diphosphokinase [Legionella hackeliae]KTD13932.1 2-amino-4-hydroxy-6- hydroxymethyldihydropteridine pyrophosphokinase [Legionella hackeliae]CEK10636.1 2-amino-4-hydroxy-6-hydroxymethyldihydropteridinepyrophosphokinase [Legionella hackeliae]STX47378.1 2-amino-4-hydroxy-6-hydroxymethyldihydropteridinepyrophosphokinase [Legionella hackeliae]
MNLCYLSLGSNLSSPERQLRTAIETLRRLPATSLLKVATLYRSKAWGRKSQPDFVNTVVMLQTTLTPQQLLAECQKIEKQQGRVRKVKWGSRTLDIDILLYGSLTKKTKPLILPHPRIHLRDFVFVPLLEIASQPITLNGKELTKLIEKDEYCLTIKSEHQK